MNDYKKLAVRYLKMNKKRSIITIAGASMAAMILYIMLNLGWSFLLTQREELREQQDYEIVFMTETQDQIEQIMADQKVKSAYIGQYYDYDYYESVTYENALYINTTNPYRLNSICEEMKAQYGVEAALNQQLAWTYMQGGTGNSITIAILMALLISFVFAIFGVGIVRNSIQLCTLEQIKDYGNMRCIGASKKQLKAIIYLEGLILELTGSAIGIVLGGIVSCIAGSILKWQTGFHIVPMIPVLIAFLGDLYFAMEENCKVVVHMTPVSAIRGEFRIRKEKIKVRRKNIFGKLFGVEGDYAYKSIMRNPGRFNKTVWALGIAVAAFMTVVGFFHSIDAKLQQYQDLSKYYHVYYQVTKKPYETIDEVQSALPPMGILENISKMEDVSEAKRVYSSYISLADWKEYVDNHTEEYLEKSPEGEFMTRSVEIFEQKAEEDNPIIIDALAQVRCYGYDESDYKRYEDMLVDGTLDVSENGIVILNGGTIEIWDETSLQADFECVNYTDYKVGDTIDFVDMEKLQQMMEKGIKELEEEYKKEKEELPESIEDEVYSYDSTPEDELNSKYIKSKQSLYVECRQQLIDEGAYKTYTIEGILKDDANHMNNGAVAVILPMKQYFAITGTDETMVTGMQYHFDKFSYQKFLNTLDENTQKKYTEFESFDCEDSAYPMTMMVIEGFQKAGYVVIGIIIFVVVMSALNIINTTASNLHLRKKELAQLRVIGISKTGLMKMVMLEGVISSIVANVIGILLGGVVGTYMVQLILTYMYGVEYVFPVGAAIIGVIVSTLILCGAVYAPLREIKSDIASDLALGGE